MPYADPAKRRAYARAYYGGHERPRFPRRVLRPENGQLVRLARLAVARAKKRGLEYAADLAAVVARIEPPCACACCSAQLEYGDAGGYGGSRFRVPRGPSLDRHDNARGYVLDNVVVICFRCNTLKRDASAYRLRLMVDYLSGGANAV